MEEKRLLVISSGYPDACGEYIAHTFVKGYVDTAKGFYNEVIVLVLLPYKPYFINGIEYKYPRFLKDYSYENVKVMYKKYPYLPIWPLKKIKGEIAYRFISPSLPDSFRDITHIHANFTVPGGVFAYFLSRKLKKDYLLTVHENHDWLVGEIGSGNKLYIKAWQNAKVIVRVNESDCSMLSKFNPNVVSIPNGFDHERFKVLNKEECKEKLNVAKDKKVIVNIGFYKEQKNQKLLIDAVGLLPENVKINLVCYIIGGGSKQEELENHVLRNHLKGIVHITGKVNHDRLPEYLNAADIFCLSSNSEGNPTVMFEALGIGIPYVGTNVGGVPEIITSEKYGLLCKPNDRIELSEKISLALQKKWNREEIMDYARQFSWQNIFLRTKDLY